MECFDIVNSTCVDFSEPETDRDVERFSINKVFGPDSLQETVFADTPRNLLNDLFGGKDALPEDVWCCSGQVRTTSRCLSECSDVRRQLSSALSMHSTHIVSFPATCPLAGDSTS